MSKTHHDDEFESPDKYERLEELLRQTLRLAGEIAESKGRRLADERIILRKRSSSDPAAAKRPDIRRSLLKTRNDLSMDDSENSQSQSQSPASSVQEPFSPGALAVSLDAVVEQGGRSQNDLTPDQDLPQGSPAASDTALQRPQKIKEERSEGEAVAVNQPSPPKGHVSILPVSVARDSSKRRPSSPAFLKFEAVFPLKAIAEGNAVASIVYNSEPSYIIIGTTPTSNSAESPLARAQQEGSPFPHEKSLREFIDEWDYDADAPGVEKKRP
ncbi:hypothetical protein Daus18300_013615 [Diaporthe australafricana]|uniref:Uncharacterized protein n=1 Tax=Diaporthe australafricana TaxID=127596 RepID=A0ABR3VYE2_9PEZI